MDFFEEHWSDEKDNPLGGTSWGPGFTISWQMGPLGSGEDRLEPNGAFVETIIEAAIGRLHYYRSGPFKSDYNARAIASLAQALEVLRARTADREARGVEGTHAQ